MLLRTRRVPDSCNQLVAAGIADEGIAINIAPGQSADVKVTVGNVPIVYVCKFHRTSAWSERSSQPPHDRACNVIHSVDQAAYVAAFAGGMVSFLSPCVLPLVPAYLSIISGVDPLEPGGASAETR